MKKPNFFIIGAPKCGTTTMAAWLAEHANIYMSPIKEPLHFDSDQPVGIKNLKEYERLFKNAGEQHIAVGEASVRYLHSKVAISNIISYNPAARFIVMLRNPIEMAPSLHDQRIFSANEDVLDFKTAWELQGERAEGSRIPPGCDDIQMLQYGEYCQTGKQLEYWWSSFDKNNLHIVFMEDLKRDPKLVYEKVLEFLGVPNDNRSGFQKLNSAKSYKSKPLALIIKMLVSAKNYMGLSSRSFGIARILVNFNRKERPVTPLDHQELRMLKDYFRDDIIKIEKLTGRDLSSWRI